MNIIVRNSLLLKGASAIYFDLGLEIIKENFEFEFFFNKSNIKPVVLDGGHQLILANWPSYKKIMHSYNSNIPINIPSHLYALLNRSIQCNCDVEAESNFLLELLAACKNSETDLVMYFTVNFAFVNYFDNL